MATADDRKEERVIQTKFAVRLYVKHPNENQVFDQYVLAPRGDGVLRVPASADWYVEVISEMASEADMPALIREMIGSKVEGLAFPCCTFLTPDMLEPLKEFAELRVLRLAGCEQLPGRVVQALSRNLAEIDLEDVPVTDDDLAALRRLVKLHTLSLARTKVTDAGLKHLGEIASLRNLSLGSTGITDNGLHQIPPTIESLDLSATGVNTVQGLEKLKKLRRLFLDGSAIDCGGIERVRDLPELVTLSLSECDDVTDTCIASLSAMKTLKYLDVSGTGVTPGGVKRLRAALPGCEVIE